jgi:glycosyltransferase involved in cell wall biosynthesis
MRIGMVAPISHAYPPLGYGPWERVTHDLTEALVESGHDVTLFAPAGSTTRAALVPTVPGPLDGDHSLDPRLTEEMHLAVVMETVAQGGLDLVHSHLHVHALVFSRLIGVPMLTTLHGAAWDRNHHRLLERYADQPFVSLSNREREYLPGLNYVATIPNGIILDDYRPGAGDGGYLAFAGRMAPEKGPDLAVETAKAAGWPLRLAGPVETRHSRFFDEVMAGVGDDRIEYVGDLSREGLRDFLADARATLMPLRWHEPFGLVVVESLAVGTPVVAWRMGAMPEIVDEAETGFLVDDVDGAVAALARINSVSRARCRAVAEERFSHRMMAEAYSGVYRDLVRSALPGSDRPVRSQP